MKLLKLENKYILFYRIIIVSIISMTLLLSVLSLLYGSLKWFGFFANSAKEIVKKVELEIPNVNLFINNYKILDEKPKILKPNLDSEIKTKEKINNKLILLKQQSERLAFLQKAFIEQQQKGFDKLELDTLKSAILDILQIQNVRVICDLNNRKVTVKICEDMNIRKKKLTNNTTFLYLDVIDVSEYSKLFFEKEFSYFELQYKFVASFLNSKIVSEAYSNGQIVMPTINAIKKFHFLFLENASTYWDEREQRLTKIEKNNDKRTSQKEKDQIFSLKVFTFSLICFGTFISTMFFVIFYRIERNLNKISELNTSLLNKFSK